MASVLLRCNKRSVIDTFLQSIDFQNHRSSSEDGGGAVVTKPGAATAAVAAVVRAEPIPIGGGGRAAAVAGAAKMARTREEMELSESYTCVISHVGGNRMRKRVYFGDGYVGVFYDDADDHLRGGATSDDGKAPPRCSMRF